MFIIIPDNRPSDIEYAVLSEHVYSKDVKQGDTVQINQEGWQIIGTKKGSNDYFGAIYKNERSKQLVLAHRGTQSFGNVIEDIQGVVLQLITAQHQEAYNFTKEAVERAKDSNLHLSSTGHSLGALLAELSVYWCHDQFNYYDINAVTFESPGARGLIEKRMLSNLKGNRTDLETLDIIQYLSYPNLINTFGSHIGTVYQIQPMLGTLGWVLGWYTKQAHSMSNIVEIFENSLKENQDISRTRVLMQDWPLGSEREKFFDNTLFLDGKYSLQKLSSNNEFVLYYKGHYTQATGIDERTQLLLRHFNQGVREFLSDFYQLHKHLLKEEKTKNALVIYWKHEKVPDAIVGLILSYKIDKYRNADIVTVLESQDIQNWRSELSSQLEKYQNIISKLLRPLKQENVNNGTVINITKTSSLDNSTRQYIEYIHRKYNIASSADYDKIKEILHSCIKYFFDRLGYFVLVIALVVGTMWYLSTKPIRAPQHGKIHSDLIIPLKNALLERPAIITKMDQCLKAESGIRTIALTGIVGIGGAGKTTMARYYAKSIDASVVWELNAETKDTLMNSFRDLAIALADSVEIKNELDAIQQSQDPATREKRLLNFVKGQLRIRPNWVLIYDNMESFDQITQLFPINSTQWGDGMVIITTRNEHVIETSYIKREDIIHIDELNQQEMLILFSKILYDCEPDKLTKQDQEKTISFLKHIPPFPLEVSMAAYSVKNMHITFEQYLKHIGEYSSSYDSNQAAILKETTQYTKTRYGIVSLTIEKLGKTNPIFKELFYFVCLLDSQNIAHELLKKYSNTEDIDNFVYHLRKNGILIRESSTEFMRENKVISIHRSTQAIGAGYLVNSLSKSEKIRFLARAVSSIKDFYHDCEKNKDTKNIILLIPHLYSVLDKIRSLDLSQGIKDQYEAELYLILGNANFKWMKNFTAAREELTKALDKNTKIHKFSTETAIHLLRDLGKINAVTNNLQEALKFNDMSIKLCKKLSGQELIIADNLQSMGASYGRINEFTKARGALEQALEIIPQSKYVESKELVAEIYMQLGNLYLTHYAHKKDGQRAEQYITKALEIFYGFELFYPNKPIPSAIPCNAARYRWRYSQYFLYNTMNYDAAEKWLNEAEYIITQKCPENLFLQGRISGNMGEVYLRKNNLFAAERKLTEAIDLISSTLGEKSAWFYKVLRSEVRIRLDKFQEGYDDAISVQNTDGIETNPLHDLRFIMTAYHAAFAQYKLGNYQQSAKYFTNFFQGIDDFCKSFLDTAEYNALIEKQAFVVVLYDKKVAVENIKTYLNQSLEIFTTIYDADNPFVRDYIAVNVPMNIRILEEELIV